MTDQQIRDIVSKNPEAMWLDTKMRLETAGDKLSKQTADNLARANQLAESMLPEGYKDSLVNHAPQQYMDMVDADPDIAFKTFITTPLSSLTMSLGFMFCCNSFSLALYRPPSSCLVFSGLLFPFEYDV